MNDVLLLKAIETLMDQVAHLQSSIEELLRLQQKINEGDIMHYEAAMDYLQCSRMSLDRMRADGQIKVYSFKGKRRLYVKRHEISQMLEHINDV